MLKIAKFEFNNFGVNTYLIIDSESNCIVVDAACNSKAEREAFTNYISDNKLKPILAINTHGHVDHICGVNFVKDTFGIQWAISQEEVPVLEMAEMSASLYGFDLGGSTPSVDRYLSEQEKIELAEGEFIEIINTPGHSAGGVCFYIPSISTLITGDTLFKGSIGRTDLPTGNYETLMSSISERILPLGDDVRVLPGHGPHSSIGDERTQNPFLTEYLTGTTNTIL